MLLQPLLRYAQKYSQYITYFGSAGDLPERGPFPITLYISCRLEGYRRCGSCGSQPAYCISLQALSASCLRALRQLSHL